MKTQYTRTEGGNYIVDLAFNDSDGPKESRLGIIKAELFGWRWECDGPSVTPEWDPFEPISRRTLADVKIELEARLYIALVGRRD